MALAATIATTATWALPGDPAGGEFQVNTLTSGDQATPSIATDADGDFVVAWNGRDPGEDVSYGIYAQRYDRNGVRRGGEFRVSAGQAFGFDQPSVAMTPSGEFAVAWSGDPANDGEEILVRRFDRDGNAVGSEIQVNEKTNGDQYNAVVAVNASGRFVVIWYDEGVGIFGRAYDENATPLGGVLQVSTPGESTSDATPGLGIAASGAFVVTWASRTLPNPNGRLFARRFAPGGTSAGAAFEVNPLGGAVDQIGPVIAMDAAGSFALTWIARGTDGSGDGIYFIRYSSADVPLVAGQVNTFTTSDQSRPSIDANAAGDFVIAWDSNQQDGSGLESIYAQRYTATGVPIGTEVHVNTTTVSRQDFAATAIDDDGDIVIAWQSRRQDGDDLGIFAQRFEGNDGPGTEVDDDGDGGGGGGGSFDLVSLGVLLSAAAWRRRRRTG